MKSFFRIVTALLLLAFIGIGVLYISQLQSGTLSTSGILVCPAPEVQDSDRVRQRRDFQLGDQQLTSAITSGTSVEMQVVSTALGLNTERGSSLDNLLVISDANPENSFAAIHALRACVEEPQHAACDASLIRRTLALEPDNTVAWSLAAGLQHQHGDDFAAAVSLQAAATAGDYDDYFIRHMILLRDALMTSDNADLNLMRYSMINQVLTLSPQNYNAWHPLMEMCGSQVGMNPLLGATCLSFGTRMQRESATLIGQLMGLSLQSVTHRELGNLAEHDRLEAAALNRHTDPDTRLAMDLMLFDDDLNRVYFDELAAAGEIAAMSHVTIEAKRRSSDADYNPCRSFAFDRTVFRVKDFLRWAGSNYIS